MFNQKQDNKWKKTHQGKNRHILGKFGRTGGFKIMIVLCIIIVIGAYIYLTKTHEKELRMYQTLQVFSQIDDIAHEQFAHMIKTGNPHHFTGSEEFLRIDHGFHNARTSEERVKRAREMDAFIGKVDIRLHKIGALDTKEEEIRDKRYHRVNDAFHKLSGQ